MTDAMRSGDTSPLWISDDPLGITFDYFFASPKARALDEVDFDAPPDQTRLANSMDTFSVPDALDIDHDGPVAVAGTGTLNIETAGTYTFFLTSVGKADFGILHVEGTTTTSRVGNTLLTTHTVDLESGDYEFSLRYLNRRGDIDLRLGWHGPDADGEQADLNSAVMIGDAPVAPPDDDPSDGGSNGSTGVSHQHGIDAVMDDVEKVHGLRAEYFEIKPWVRSYTQIDFDSEPVATGVVGQLKMSGSDPFWEGGPEHRFAARYTGELDVSDTGTYTIYLTSDDGSAVYLDGVKIIDNDGAHAPVEKSVEIELDAGHHELEVVYFEKNGGQTLKLEWEGPASDGERRVISGEDFAALEDDGATDGGHGDMPDHGDDSNTDTGSGPVDEEDDVDGHDGHDMDGDDDHDMGGDGDMDGHDGHDMGGSGWAGTEGKSDAEIAAYVEEVKSAPEAHAHGDDAGKMTEHMQALDLVPRSEATHVAVNNGDWFDPDTWFNGKIPGEGAKVLIPEDLQVTYDGESDVSLFTVRVDGKLEFATDVDTKMLLDTMLVSPSGKLEIGTEDNPVHAGNTAQIIIANNGDIDVGWDPSLLSRGVISHGAAEIHGADKTEFLKVSDAPMAGDTVLELSEIPEGWAVGDTLMLTGTHKTGWTWTGSKYENLPSEDEVVTIAAIDGDKVTIDRPLEFDHDTPRADLFAYVANMTRNVQFTSEDGDATEVHHRGHVMFMHNDEVDVRYASFVDLGRTDKSTPAFDVASLDTVESDSNIKARYPFHFHKTGTGADSEPAMAVGNVVDGAPGWAYVHHSSNADFVRNIAFDVFGAAFAAEAGDETGQWWQNLAVNVDGIGAGHTVVKAGDDVERHDTGRTGDGFFFAGRLVEAGENVAANTTHGYVWMHRRTEANPLSENLDHPDIAYGSDKIRVDHAPIQGFVDNEAFGTQVGMIVVKDGPKQGHDIRTVMDGFLNWETSEGAQITYTSHYTMKNFDLIGTYNTDRGATAKTGFEFGNLTFDLTVNGLKLQNFKTGVDLDQRLKSDQSDADVDHNLIDVTFIDVATEFLGFDPDRHTIMTSEDLVEGRLTFQMLGDTTLSLNEDLVFDGIKTDSIGSRDRQFSSDHQSLDSGNVINKLLADEGYYKTADGKKVMFITDFVADRATGDLLKFSHVVTLDMTDAQLEKLGAVYNGKVDLSGVAPVAEEDRYETGMGEALVLDVLANDHDPDDDPIRIDGFTNPGHGTLEMQEDGTLLYTPNDNYEGVEEFSYWTADDQGFFTEGHVYVEIFDGG